MFTLLLTCEHATNVIPKAYQRHFASREAQQALTTHAGLDLGALVVAQALRRSLSAPLYCGSVSRLLVELNRSSRHPKLWSKFSQALSSAQKQAALDEFYNPHRVAVETHIAGSVKRRQPVLHVGVHSFTPVLGDEVRTADIGLLYDPKRQPERALCKQWQQLLNAAAPTLRVRRNYPYRGDTDGFTTTLRRRFPARLYLGIEIELNQSLLVGPSADKRGITRLVAQTLGQVLAR